VIGLRVLVAYENDKRVYKDAVTQGIQDARPHVEVTVVELETLEEGMARFAPHLLICVAPPLPMMRDQNAWMELSPNPDQPSKICVGGQHRELLNPSLEDLIKVVDETETLVAGAASYEAADPHD
jgi:hypothetical protein